MFCNIVYNFKQKLIRWCTQPSSITIGELHEKLTTVSCEIYDNDELKFIEQSTPQNILIETPFGFSPILHTHKTVKYEVYELILKDGFKLLCADKHIVMDNLGKERNVDSLTSNDWIETKYGAKQVVSVTKLNCPVEHMYDIELNDQHHLYYTNNIVSHNSQTSAIFLLWFAMFNLDKTVLIAANKNANAMEMISRIAYSYEALPMWLKPGVTQDGFNKHEIKFDNGSRIVSTATSANSGRGMSISLLFLDEFAFVAKNVQDEFWTSILPTLSTGGACIMTSTPNGATDKFSSIWRSANFESAKDGMQFVPIHVKWDEPPGRDEQFKRDQIAMLGELKWRQEYECEFLSSDPLLIDSLILNKLKEGLKQPIRSDMGFEFYQELQPGKTYLLGIDPATGSGEDFTVMFLYDFHTLTPVALFRSNSMSSSSAYAHLKLLLNKIESLKSTCFFSIENNGVGEGIIALYENDEVIPDGAEFISEDGANRLGMRTESRIKLRMCLMLKQLVESGKIKVWNNILHEELSNFSTTSKGSYAAQVGATDDVISALLIIIRLLEEMSTYDQHAFDAFHHYQKVGKFSDEEVDESDIDEEYDENYEPDPFVW